MVEIKLTEEQKNCAEYPLDQKILVINADPGTGKTEVLKQRVLFIHQQNPQQKKLILVLAYGRNIAAEIRTKLKAHKLKVYSRLKKILPELAHHHTCSLDKCPTYWENRRPLVLVCTIHSLANGINDLVIKKQFQEERKIQILVATQRVEQKQGLISHEEQNQKFAWKSLGAIKSRKKRLFNYLFKRIADNYWEEISQTELWKFFAQSEPENVILTKNITPYYHYEINYVRFLSQVSSLLPANSQLLVKLEEVCHQDQAKNIWLDFEDLITNANKLISQPEQKIWPEFDYILVDECQDLKAETLRLITKIFGSEDTSFTFVGDPKQNIYGFAGATEDIFTLLEQQFPQQTQSIIATSFRLSPEIAEYSNDFIKKFMTYRASIQTTKPRTGQQPQIFIVGQDPDYQLSPHEVIEIEQEVAMNTTIKRNDLVQNKIRQKKLHQHLEVVLQLINQLDKFSSKAILYRQNWIGNLLQKWLTEKCIMTSISEKIIEDIIRQVQRQFKGSISKLKEKSTKKNKENTIKADHYNPLFSSLHSFLTSLNVSENSIFQLAEIINQLDENQTLSLPDKINTFITQLEEIKSHQSIILSTIHGMKGLEADHVFLIFCDKKILPKKDKFTNEWEEREEKNLFFTAITRPRIGLYITTSSLAECSKFIEPTKLDTNLVKIITI